jgi:hypothetical protein
MKGHDQTYVGNHSAHGVRWESVTINRRKQIFGEQKISEPGLPIPQRRHLRPSIHINPINALRNEHLLHVHFPCERPSGQTPEPHLNAFLVRSADEHGNASKSMEEEGEPVEVTYYPFEGCTRNRGNCWSQFRMQRKGGEVGVEEDVPRVRRISQSRDGGKEGVA